MLNDFVTKERRVKRSYPTSPDLDKVMCARDIFNIIFSALLLFIVIDVIAYVSWTVTGQTPIDNFYLGALTNLILQTI